LASLLTCYFCEWVNEDYHEERCCYEVTPPMVVVQFEIHRDGNRFRPVGNCEAWRNRNWSLTRHLRIRLSRPIAHLVKTSDLGWRATRQ